MHLVKGGNVVTISIRYIHYRVYDKQSQTAEYQVITRRRLVRSPTQRSVNDQITK